MQVFTKTINYRSKADQVTIWPMGDFHIGASGCHEKRLAEDIAKIKDGGHEYIIGMGDYMDCVVHSDTKRFDPKALPDWLMASDLNDMIERQIERCAELLSPVADRLLCLLAGNHEEKLRTRYHRDPTEALARELKYRTGITVPVLGKCAWIKLAFARCRSRDQHNLDIVAHHGWFAGRKSGSKTNNLQDALGNFDCDVLVVAHGHDPVVTRKNQLRLNLAAHITERQQVGMMTGSYLRTYAQNTRGYGEDAGYRPTVIGALPIHLRPHTGSLTTTY